MTTSVPDRRSLEPLVDLFRGALLRTSSAPDLHERIDLANMALAFGDRQGARLLLLGVGLELGCSGEALRWWRDTGQTTGLWSIAWDAPDDGSSLFCVDRAMLEMRAIATTVAASLPVKGAPAAVPGDFSPAPVEEGSAMSAPIDRIDQAIEMFLAAAEPRVAKLMDDVAAAMPEAISLDVRHMVGYPVTDITRAIALGQLHRQARMIDALRQPPLGSDALVEHAARLAPGGLGPWFGALSRLVRNEEDLVAWPYTAAKGLLPADLLPDWCVLLTITAPRSRMEALMRQFGRFKLQTGLEAISRRLWVLPPVDATGYEFNDLRDVCLANGFGGLAIAAQRRIVALRPLDGNERIILADMLAFIGEADEAALILGDLLREKSNSVHLIERAEAAKNETLRDYVALHGFFGDAQYGPTRRRGMAA